MRKICTVTGSRADYGLLYWIIKGISEDPDLELQIVATGMHLSPEFGYTVQVILDDGFTVHKQVEMLLSGDSAESITKSIGLGVMGFADAFRDLKPDIIVVLGDRFEIFSAVQAALIARIPVAHIAGGDVTEGAYDEAMRHAITKMSHLHFATNEAATMRLQQLGEDPGHVYNVGSPGIDYIRRMIFLTRDELEKDLNIKFLKRNFLVTFHPSTLDPEHPGKQFAQVLKALDHFPETGIVFTRTNADSNGRTINRTIDDYLSTHSNAYCFTSLGQLRYLSLINEVDAVVGNSSSGLYEVPSLHKPTVNIGDRQKGRLMAESVISCPSKAGEIENALWRALNMDCSAVRNPYGDGYASERIIAILKDIKNPETFILKRFHDLVQ